MTAIICLGHIFVLCKFLITGHSNHLLIAGNAWDIKLKYCMLCSEAMINKSSMSWNHGWNTVSQVQCTYLCMYTTQPKYFTLVWHEVIMATMISILRLHWFITYTISFPCFPNKAWKQQILMTINITQLTVMLVKARLLSIIRLLYKSRKLTHLCCFIPLWGQLCNFDVSSQVKLVFIKPYCAAEQWHMERQSKDSCEMIE